MISTLMIAAAAYCFALAGFHVMFWRLFHWPSSLTASGTINVGVTQTLNLMLTLGQSCLETAERMAPPAASEEEVSGTRRASPSAGRSGAGAPKRSV